MKQRQYIKKCTSYNAPIVHLIHLFSAFFGNNSSIVHITLVTKDHLFNIFICMLKLPRKFYFSYQSVRRSNQSESWTLSQHAMTVPIEKGKHKVMERSKNFGLSQVSLLFYWFMFTFLCRFFCYQYYTLSTKVMPKTGFYLTTFYYVTYKGHKLFLSILPLQYSSATWRCYQTFSPEWYHRPT